MSYAYGDELAIVPYVKHEIVAIAPTHDSPMMVFLLPLHMMILMNIICMCLLLLLAIIMREELHLRLFMFPIR